MKTNHKIVFENSNNMKDVPTESVNLIVTSPPYPMIEIGTNNFLLLIMKSRSSAKRRGNESIFTNERRVKQSMERSG